MTRPVFDRALAARFLREMAQILDEGTDAPMAVGVLCFYEEPGEPGAELFVPEGYGEEASRLVGALDREGLDVTEYDRDRDREPAS